MAQARLEDQAQYDPLYLIERKQWQMAKITVPLWDKCFFKSSLQFIGNHFFFKSKWAIKVNCVAFMCIMLRFSSLCDSVNGGSYF